VISIGIDNGVSGSVAIVDDGRLVAFRPTPVRRVLHWGKRGKFRHRVDHERAYEWLSVETAGHIDCRAVVERPMVNPQMFASSLSAVAALEAVEILLERMAIGYEVVDSRAWQKRYLGEVKGSKDLKAASLARGVQMFPQFADAFRRHGDADAVFLALLANDR
jgi:hypothetical protein